MSFMLQDLGQNRQGSNSVFCSGSSFVHIHIAVKGRHGSSSGQSFYSSSAQ